MSDLLQGLWGPLVEQARLRGLPLNRSIVHHLLNGGDYLVMHQLYCGRYPARDRHGDSLIVPVVVNASSESPLAIPTKNDLEWYLETYDVPAVYAIGDDASYGRETFVWDYMLYPYWECLPLSDHELPEAIEISAAVAEALDKAGLDIASEVDGLIECGEVDPEACWEWVHRSRLSKDKREAVEQSFESFMPWFDEDEIKYGASMWQEFLDKGGGAIFDSLPSVEDVLTLDRMRLIRRQKHQRETHRAAYFASMTAAELRKHQTRSYI